MGLFDAFSSKNKEIEALQKISQEFKDTLTRLEKLEMSLPTHLEKVKEVSFVSSEIPKNLQESFDKIQNIEQEVVKTREQIENFKIADNQTLQKEVDNTVQNLSSFNMTLEMQIQDVNSLLQNLNNHSNNVNKSLNTLTPLIDEIPSLKSSVSKLILKVKKQENK